MRRNRIEPMPDDGLAGFRAGPIKPAEVEMHARSLLAGFDRLPKELRDFINYAPTPEGGAQTIQACITHELGFDFWQDIERAFFRR